MEVQLQGLLRGGEHLTAEDMFACIETRFPQDGTGTSRDQLGDARHGILPIVTPHDVNVCGWIGKGDESNGLGGGVFPVDHELPSVVAVNNAVTPADIADVVAGRRAPLLSVDSAVYRRDAIEEETIRRQTRRAESRNGVNAGVVTDSDDEEDFAEPLVDTTMLRRIASQNHYHVDLNNDREWELPEPLDRDYRKARYALLKDALSRLEEEPELLDNLREHMLHPTLLPVLAGAMKLEHEEEEERQRKSTPGSTCPWPTKRRAYPSRIVSSGTATSSSSISTKWNITRSSRRGTSSRASCKHNPGKLWIWTWTTRTWSRCASATICPTTIFSGTRSATLTSSTRTSRGPPPRGVS